MTEPRSTISQSPSSQTVLPRSAMPFNITMESCIQACMDCHKTCLEMAMTHCLQIGGKHVETQHFRLMLNCAEICQTAANFMLSESTLHEKLCAVCSDVCKACAESCKRLGDMDECVAACERCARECRAMSY